MNECEIDVSIGETLCLGDISVTILGIEDGEIHFWNQAAETIFGWTNQEVIGKDVHKFFLLP